MRAVYLFFMLLLAVSANSQNRPALFSGPENVSIKPYPNPASTQVTFNFETGYDKNYSFQIYNFIGKKVYELRSLNARTVVNVTDFYRGLYIFQVSDKNGKVINSGKFTVER